MRTSEPRDPRRSRGSVASGAGSSSGPTAAPASGTSRWWAWLGLTVVAAVVVAAVLRALTGPVYLIPSGSMEPTLQPGDRVRVDAAAAGGQERNIVNATGCWELTCSSNQTPSRCRVPSTV